jgi:hypothetical protein
MPDSTRPATREENNVTDYNPRKNKHAGITFQAALETLIMNARALAPRWFVLHPISHRILSVIRRVR